MENLTEWHVNKQSENGGRAEAILHAKFKCPACGFNFPIKNEIVYSTFKGEGAEVVSEELAKFRACPECGTVMGLTEIDQHKMKKRLGDKAPDLV